MSRNREGTTGDLSGATNSRYDNLSNPYNAVGSMSYVTGSHASRPASSIVRATWRIPPLQRRHVDDDLFQRAANSVTVLNRPMLERDDLNADFGIYAQDRWTVSRMTLNRGARFDHFNVGRAVESRPPDSSCRAPLRATQGLPNWHDWSIRLGGAYDLFGNGKTAVKGTVGKYLAGEALGSRGTTTRWRRRPRRDSGATSTATGRRSTPTATPNSRNRPDA